MKLQMLMFENNKQILLRGELKCLKFRFQPGFFQGLDVSERFPAKNFEKVWDQGAH